MSKCVAIILAILFLPFTAKAQSDFDFTQRWFNESLYNPAATGNSFGTDIFLHGRAQWIGLEGAPTTEAVYVNAYFEGLRSGFGLGLTGDQIGFTHTYSCRAAYAYFVPTGKASYISFGLSASIVSRNRNAYGALVDELDDPDLFYGNSSHLTPDFDFGVEYKGPIKIGASIRHLGTIPSTDFLGYAYNVWTYASMRINVARGMSLEPVVSFMYREKISRYEAGAILRFYQLDRKSGYDYKDRWWIGAISRFHGQFTIMAGMEITKNIRAGYSFDYGASDLARISEKGSHEIFVALSFNRLFQKKELCPAFKNSGYDTRAKKKFMDRIKYKFEIY
ncbi:MAG: PorP/SprF family type IX secretion system membrane protein [Prevotellaceae bacterium]|jgi:type IX secretion system PorP/SprF family membrane protein|nr:PorP/SprF family type IX secretion system membrane protein [Prevotellaceae bacterium]